MKKKEEVNFDGKKMDYYEFSNSIGQDIVEVFKKADELHKLCQERKVPLIIGLVSDKKDFCCSISYLSEWDNKTYDKLRVIAGGTIKYYRELLGIVYDFNRIDFSERK